MSQTGLVVKNVEHVPVRIPLRGGGTHEAVIVILTSREGLTGLGEAAVVPGRGHTLESVFEDLRRPGGPTSAPARFALTTAIFDLGEKVHGVSEADRLGSIRRRSVRCSALIRARRPADVAREVEAAREAGFVTFKLKARGCGSEADLERIGAARYAAGPDNALRLDFEGGLSLDQALSLLPALQRFRLELIEQPLPARAPVAEWLALDAEAWWPLYADESLADPVLARQLGAAGIGFAVKLATVGGWEWLDEFQAGFPAGQFLIGSSMETSIGVAAALMAACAMERPMPDCGLATTGLLEADLAHGLDLDGPWLTLPPGPGLGVVLDREVLDRYRLDR